MKWLEAQKLRVGVGFRARALGLMVATQTLKVKEPKYQGLKYQKAFRSWHLGLKPQN